MKTIEGLYIYNIVTEREIHSVKNNALNRKLLLIPL